jgi:2-dehydropantoate 2-reductase
MTASDGSLGEHPRIAILGCGAIGGLLGFHLARSNAQVTLIDQTQQVSVLREDGLQLISPAGDRQTTRNFAAATPEEELPDFDLVILAVKAHQIQDTLSVLARITNEGSVVMTVQNGIPWWYFQNYGGEHADRVLESVDAGGLIARSIPSASIVGCVAYPAAECVGPGVIQHVEGNRFTLGEISDKSLPRTEQVGRILGDAGFKTYVIENIRDEIWLKAWGALAFNPVGALTAATMAGICRNEQSRKLVIAMMREAETIAQRLGVKMRVPLEKRLVGAEKVGEHKTSMLQDREASRKMEVGAILGSIVELADITSARAPTLENILAILNLLDESLEN